ncbi:hypothetical protein [Streptomyces poriticola]|uniref:hypothetical protein n=1 Tax=Streptomyces poriticola TaxID=3120506 RepID=UPI002FCE5D02
MRVLLKATLDTEKGNEAIRAGKMPDLINGVVAQLKPEAAYFGPIGGRRTALLVFEMQDSSELPPAAEAFFTQANADVEVCPIMNAEELQKGLSRMSTG